MGLGRKLADRKTGAEVFTAGAEKLGFDLQDFWRWSASDILSNATRGVPSGPCARNPGGRGRAR